MWGNEIGASSFHDFVTGRSFVVYSVSASRLDSTEYAVKVGYYRGTFVSGPRSWLYSVYPITWENIYLAGGPEPLGSGCLDRPVQSKNLGRVNLPNCTGIGGS